MREVEANSASKNTICKNEGTLSRKDTKMQVSVIGEGGEVGNEKDKISPSWIH